MVFDKYGLSNDSIELTFDWNKGKYILSQVGLAYINSWLVFGLLSYIFIKIKLFRK